MNPAKYLVFGATGNVGGRVTQRLLAAGARPRVFVRSEARARASFGSQVEVHTGDLDRPGRSLGAALEGVDGVFLVTDGPQLERHDHAVAVAAREAGVRHLVKLSTLDVRTGVGTGPWHARGEAAVRDSGVVYTFLHAAGFMSNALGWADSIRRHGVLHSSTGEGSIAFIHPEDIAAVAVAALTSRRPRGASPVITGATALSYRAMAASIGRAIGKPIGYEAISDRQAHARTVAWAGAGAYADALVDIWRAVREGRLDTVTDGVAQILGRPPIGFDAWATENAAYFQ